MNWVYLFIAGLLEVVWAYYMKQSAGFTRLVPSIITIVSMLASFALLAVAMRSLPLGSAYAVWTGIGAAGAFVVGIIVFHEQVSIARLAAVLMILAGIVLLKITSGT